MQVWLNYLASDFGSSKNQHLLTVRRHRTGWLSLTSSNSWSPVNMLYFTLAHLHSNLSTRVIIKLISWTTSLTLSLCQKPGSHTKWMELNCCNILQFWKDEIKNISGWKMNVSFVGSMLKLKQQKHQHLRSLVTYPLFICLFGYV